MVVGDSLLHRFLDPEVIRTLIYNKVRYSDNRQYGDTAKLYKNRQEKVVKSNCKTTTVKDSSTIKSPLTDNEYAVVDITTELDTANNTNKIENNDIIPSQNTKEHIDFIDKIPLSQPNTDNENIKFDIGTGAGYLNFILQQHSFNRLLVRFSDDILEREYRADRIRRILPYLQKYTIPCLILWLTIEYIYCEIIYITKPSIYGVNIHLIYTYFCCLLLSLIYISFTFTSSFYRYVIIGNY